jgi:hypothetical protein
VRDLRPGVYSGPPCILCPYISLCVIFLSNFCYSPYDFFTDRINYFTHLLFETYLFSTPPNCVPNPRRALRLLFARPTTSSTRRPRPTVQLLTYPSGGTLPLRGNITTYNDGILLSIRSLISESLAEECGGGCGEAPTQSGQDRWLPWF